MHAHEHEAGKASSIRPYLYKRLTRIFPAYWPVGLALLGLYAALPGLSASGGREYSYLSSVLLLPANLPPALSVAWTLVHELMFYALFMLWFVSRRAFWLGMAAWVLAITINVSTDSTVGWLRYPFSLLNIEFMLGVLTALAYTRFRFIRLSGSMILAGVLLTTLTLLLLYLDAISAEGRLLFALGLAVMLLGLASYERKQRIEWSTALLTLGNASYSIYLIHNPMLSFTQRIAGRLDFSWPTGLIVGILASIILGYLYFQVVERPALQRLRTFQPLQSEMAKPAVRI